MDNIERFNRVAAVLFKRLYESFPSPILNFDSESLCEEAGIPPTAVDSRSILCFSGDVVKWLHDEDFVRYKSVTHGRQFFSVVMTQKGLAAMNRVPDSIAPTQTVGDRLKELGRETSSQTIGQLVQLAIGTGVAAAVRVAAG